MATGNNNYLGVELETGKLETKVKSNGQEMHEFRGWPRWQGLIQFPHHPVSQ